MRAAGYDATRRVGGMRLTALDGTEWEVTRRADGVGVAAAALFLALSVAGWTLAIVLGAPSLLFLLELVALVVLLLPGGRAYVVSARNRGTGEVRLERIRGRRAAERARQDLARELSRGA
jgi:hypothetical protein